MSQENLPIVAVSQFEQTFQNDRYMRAAANPDNYEAMLETQLIKVLGDLEFMKEINLNKYFVNRVYKSHFLETIHK